MKIGVSTANYFPEIDTEDMIDLYAKAGIDTVEVFLNTYAEMTVEFIGELKRRIDHYGMTVNSVHIMSMVLEPCLFDLHTRRRQDFLDIYKRTLQCIRALDCSIYTFHGPPVNMALPQYLDHIARCYDVLYELAGAAGVSLAQENVAYLASGRPEFIVDMKHRMNQRMFHTFDIKQAVKAGVDPYHYLAVIGNDMVNLHLNDNDETRHCLTPGQGTFDFERLFQTLASLDYKGNGIIELYRHNFIDEKELVTAQAALIRQAQKYGL